MGERLSLCPLRTWSGATEDIAEPNARLKDWAQMDEMGKSSRCSVRGGHGDGYITRNEEGSAK